MSLIKFRNRSLQNRLILNVGIIFVFAYFCALFITQWIYLHFSEKQFQQHFFNVAQSIATVSHPSGENKDEASMNYIGRLFQMEKEIQFIILVDPRRQISLFKSRTGFTPPEFPDQFLESIDLEKIADPQFSESESRKLVIYPIFGSQPGESRRYILMGVDDSLVFQLSRRARYSALVISVIFLVTGLILLQWFSIRVTRPIKDLMSGADRVINGNFSHQIKVTDEGELGSLTRKFNEMTLKLHYFNKQKSLLNKKLNEYNEKLEEKVKERADQLRKIQQEVLSILHQIPVGLLVTDKNSCVMWYNHELMNIVELPYHEKIGNLKITDVKKFVETGLCGILSTLEKKPDRQVAQYHLNFKQNKTPRLVEIASQALIRGASEVDGSIFIIRDVTREVLLEKKMVQDQRLENIGKIAGGIAHDFNNILAIILPNAQLLKMQLQEHPEWVKYLDTIEKAADQAASLTRKILSFSRGGSQDRIEVLNVNHVITDFSKMFRRVLDRKIEIKEKLEPVIWNIKAERAQIEQILMNLSVNSRDAMPDKGELIFKTENVVIEPDDLTGSELKLKPGKYVCISISDTGTGIPRKYLDKIFDPFFSSKKDGQGTGLGLSVVYGIVKSHQGLIDVKSKEKQGTEFHIYIPASEEEVEEVQENKETMVSGSGSVTLLIVDDEEMIQQTLKGMLESLNYKVIFADNGKNAVNIYKSGSRQIDAILMDIQMPVMDGVEAAEEILKINPHARIVFTSGYAEAGSFEKLRKMGYQLFLKKPYKITNLADIIQTALSQGASYN